MHSNHSSESLAVMTEYGFGRKKVAACFASGVNLDSIPDGADRIQFNISNQEEMIGVVEMSAAQCRRLARHLSWCAEKMDEQRDG